jgi:hypothetical protein
MARQVIGQINAQNQKKLRTSKVYIFKPNNIRFDMKGKEEALELDEVANVVEDEMQNNDFKENVDFFEIMVANLKTWNHKILTNCWYFDSGATKHVSKDKVNFKVLEFFLKIRNVKFGGGQTHGVYGKGKVKFLSSFGKIKTIVDVFYVLGFMKNLLLVGTIVDKGNIVIIDSNKCLVIEH